MQEIDFRSHALRWGHMLHGNTWRRNADGSQSVMVHSSREPKKGDVIVYDSEGGDRRGTIVDVEPCLDPRDMYTLHYRTELTNAE